MLKFFTNPASKYAYLRSLERANFIIWPTPGRGESVKGIKIKKIEICTFSIANISNLGQPLGQLINFHS